MCWRWICFYPKLLGDPLAIKILLIEDDESFSAGIALMLRPENIEVEVAQTASEGIKAYRKNIHSFATVIVEQIRKMNPSQDILFASGYDQTGSAIKSIMLGPIKIYEIKHRMGGLGSYST